MLLYLINKNISACKNHITKYIRSHFKLDYNAPAMCFSRSINSINSRNVVSEKATATENR